MRQSTPVFHLLVAGYRHPLLKIRLQLSAYGPHCLSITEGVVAFYFELAEKHLIHCS
ncbi:hypothetical protein BDA99DRAFT_515643 [Phascolomyces articulosus]|uniref:Uncharacterized protein n=1 Tax=Phascolomyces articulosus TaxID=60185 RepID=A0AAD5K5M6_9FUNG|nr:hypothetical protein BDA99DRAFT_515643 [Phascolomyces articulosus]